ncbi:MAG: formyltetrahydrofolate deformylase [Victivallaceae bacterium]|nr:formyltetrahydrofolate deformylase [Victivallaceae bacterium]
METRQAVILIKAEDRKGLVSQITGFFFSRDLNIVKCQQYTDPRGNTYYMRLVVELGPETTWRSLDTDFAKFAQDRGLTYRMFDRSEISRIAVLVTKASHCLYDILARAEENTLGGKVVLVVGNHPDLEDVADRFRIPFYCLPVAKGHEKEQESALADLLERERIDLVVLARYMRILSDDFIAKYPQRIINIHHAFLPAFQGGNPYERAWERGVKMIGATAHYATAELDEGPIIEQDVERISHEDGPDDLREIGRDIERRVLSRAVEAHLSHRVIVDGRRTIVFGR